MSTVYRAFDTVLERQVAIKLMHREIAGDSDQLERFRREARAVAQLNHPHIVGVIDAGEEGDPDHPTPYIVFEYVEGETLKQRIRRNSRLSIAESIAYAIEIARALGAAHERQIVHRDVKPQNVLIDEEGAAKVTDFGIARTLHQEGLTADGRVLGTTDYVSPEQALGRPVTGQTDLYSLGIVLFEMLTGDVPFKGENQIAVAMKHVREDLPDVQLRRPEVSAALAAVLDRATAKDLDRRYPDAQAMIADLEDVLATETARTGHVTGEATTVLRSLPASAAEARAAARAQLAQGAARRAARARARRRGRARLPQHARRARDRQARERRAGGAGPEVGAARPARGDGLRPARRRRRALRRDERARRRRSLDDLVDGDLRRRPAQQGRRRRHHRRLAGRRRRASASRSARRRRASRPRSGSPTPAGRRPRRPTGWTRVSSESVDVGAREPIDLDTAGNRYRRYLVWITKLPPEKEAVEISEILLYRDGAGASEAVGALVGVALDRQRAEPLDELGVGQPAGLPELRVDARRREAGHRVELVEQHALALDEEVRAREARAAEVRERRDRDRAQLVARGAARCRPARAAASRRARTWRRSRTSRRR